MPEQDLRLSVPNLFIDWIEAKGRKQMLLPYFHAKTIKGEERTKKQTVSYYLTILAQSEACPVIASSIFTSGANAPTKTSGQSLFSAFHKGVAAASVRFVR